MFKLYFEISGLTEEERDILCAKLDIIKTHIYPRLEYDFSMVHRGNRVWIDQEIKNINTAMHCFECLNSIDFPKEYDTYYKYGEDSVMECSLSFTKEFSLQK